MNGVDGQAARDIGGSRKDGLGEVRHRRTLIPRPSSGKSPLHDRVTRARKSGARTGNGPSAAPGYPALRCAFVRFPSGSTQPGRVPTEYGGARRRVAQVRRLNMTIINNTSIFDRPVFT